MNAVTAFYTFNKMSLAFFCLRDAFFGEVDIRESADAVCSVHGCFAVACDVQFHLTTPFTLFPRCCKAAFRCLPSRGRGL